MFNETGLWESTLNHVIKGVVSIQFYSCKKFETNKSSSGVATGFIVYLTEDFGIILSNRHVVKTGPTVVEVLCCDF